MASRTVPLPAELKPVAARYQDQLFLSGIPRPAAATIALAIARFERNLGRPDLSTRRLIQLHKVHICRANLWRFQLLSTTSLKRISNRLPHRP